MTRSPKSIKVFVRDESKIEAILQFLWNEGIPFHILGRQALLLPTESAYKNLATAEEGWFDVERVKDGHNFPEICFKDSTVRNRRWVATIPDRFVWRDLPEQKPRPSRR